MRGQWETLESGPADAERTVLLLPGGLNTARSYAELMAQPGLAGVRLVAVTLPGHGGTSPPEDFSIEHYARLAADSQATLAATWWRGSASRPSCASWTASAVRWVTCRRP